MKTKLATLLLTAASGFGFAAELPMNHDSLPREVRLSLADARADRDWLAYVRMGLADSRADNVNMTHVVPGLGAGVRYALPLGAIDLSASYTGTDAFAKEVESYFYTLPRATYLLYASPSRQQSFYAGAGLAFGGVKKTFVTPVVVEAVATEVTLSSSETFTGLVPNVSVGYEMNRLQNWRSFIQLDVSQPAVAFTTVKDKAFMSIADAKFGPLVELSVGFGY